MEASAMKQHATQMAWVLALMVGLGACTRYEVETTLSADGSGSRMEEVVVARTEDSEIDVTPEEYRSLMNVTRAVGWTHESSVDGDDSVHVFRRRHAIEDLGGWSDHALRQRVGVEQRPAGELVR